MTREMNKPDWKVNGNIVTCYKKNAITTLYVCHCLCKECFKPKERKLNEWIKPFFDNCCRMEKLK